MAERPVELDLDDMQVSVCKHWGTFVELTALDYVTRLDMDEVKQLRLWLEKAERWVNSEVNDE